MIRVLLAALAASLAAASGASAGTGMFVGAAEDAPRSTDFATAKAKLDLAARAGLGAVRLTSTWRPGLREVEGDELATLRTVAAAARLDGVRPIVSVSHRDQRTTPLTARARAEFAAYAASIVREVPAIRDVIVANEPNLNLFWMPQFTKAGGDAAAVAYERLLADVYDALKAVSPDVNVIGGALSPRGQDRAKSKRQTHSPTAFLLDLGLAYRASGRTAPLMDMLAFHPYLIPSRLPPTFTHPRTTTIGISDYRKLTSLLARAFGGTAQPGAALPIVYDEFGYQSEIPAEKQALYTNLAAPAARDAVSEAVQAAQYRQALEIAACQPTVVGLLLFHVSDETDARAWQSGLYYADDTPKTSLAGVRDAALAAAAGTLARCAVEKRPPAASVVFRAPAAGPGDALRVDLACGAPCAYELRVVAAADGAVVQELAGSGVGELSLPFERPRPGLYQYTLRAFSSGLPATALVCSSAPFAVAAAAAEQDESDTGAEEALPPPTAPLPTLTPLAAPPERPAPQDTT